VPKSLDTEVVERLRAKVRDEIIPRIAAKHDLDVERAKSKTAEALGVDAATINRLVNKGEGGSLDLIRRVANWLNDSPSKILWGSDDSPVRKLNQLPDFEVALAEATQRLREHPGLKAADLEYAGTSRVVPEPERVTAGLIIQLALSRMHSTMPPPATRTVTRPQRRR
jgi:transcriptional regulator with XRE-family HTH domain